jgi:hypothetical protein
MSTNGSPPKTANMAPPGGLFGSQQRPDDNVGASDSHAGNTPNKDTQFGQLTNQFPPPPGYSYPLLGVVPSSDNDTRLIQDAYISTICITPMHVII